MRATLICSMLALVAPAADAGDFSFRLLFGDRRERHDDYYCRTVYERAHWETVERRVFIPAEYERRWVPPRFEWRYDSRGQRFQVMISSGRHERVEVYPARWETRRERVHVPGRYVYDCDTPGHRHEFRVGVRVGSRHDRDDDRRGHRH